MRMRMRTRMRMGMRMTMMVMTIMSIMVFGTNSVVESHTRMLWKCCQRQAFLAGSVAKLGRITTSLIHRCGSNAVRDWHF